MKCKKCNALLPEGATKCPECGAEYGKKNAAVMLAVLVAVAFVVGVLVAVLIMSLTNKPEPADSVTAVPTVPTVPSTAAPTNPLIVETDKDYTVSDDVILASANEVVATAGEYELTVSQLQTYYWNVVYEFLDQNNCHEPHGKGS